MLKISPAHLFFRILGLATLSFIFLNIAIYKNFDSSLPFGFLMALFLLIFTDRYIFKKHQTLHEALFPIVLVNIFLLLLFYIMRYELRIPLNYFRVGFTYDNFWDFYYQLLVAADQSYKSVSSGYLPLSQAISKFLAKIDHWDGLSPNVSNRTINMYIFFYFICISPIFLYFKSLKNKLNINHYYLSIFLIFSSYPFLFSFERGNFVLISFCFFSCSLYFFSNKKYSLAALFISLFFSLKIFNFILLPFFLRYFKVKFWVQSFFVFLIVSASSLIYLFNLDFSKWIIFINVFLAPFQGITNNARDIYVVSDGGALQGMSSWDSYRIMLNVLIKNIKSNLTTNSSTYNLIYAFFGFTIIGFYYYKNFASKKHAPYIECLILLMVGMAFHSGSADYNLLLLTPLIFLILSQYKFEDIQDILKPLFIIFSLIGAYVINIISLDPGSKTYLSMSLKSFLTPFLLTYSILHCIRFSIKQKQ